MAEVRPDVSNVRRPSEDRNPPRQLTQRPEAPPREPTVLDHRRPQPAPESLDPTDRKEPSQPKSAEGFQPTQTKTENLSHQSTEFANEENEAVARLAAAQKECQRAEQIYKSTPDNSPMSFRRWKEFCQAKTNLGLAEIGVGSARIANSQMLTEPDRSLITDWEAVFDGRI